MRNDREIQPCTFPPLLAEAVCCPIISATTRVILLTGALCIDQEKWQQQINLKVMGGERDVSGAAWKCLIIV